MGRTEVYLSFARLGTSRPPVKRPGGDAPFAGWGKCSERVSACNGEHLASVKRVLGKIAQAVTHSTLQYVSSVAFEQATPLYGKESPTLESPFLRANSKIFMRQCSGGSRNLSDTWSH